MRPNADIPWSIHGRVKEYAEAKGITVEDAYIRTLEEGIDQISIPDSSGSTGFAQSKEWFPFGPRVIKSKGEESHHINRGITCFTGFSTPDQALHTETRIQNLRPEEVEERLANLHSTGYIDKDWFTLQQLGGAWVGRGMSNFSQTLKNAKDLYASADFPLYKEGIVVYVASLSRENEYLIIRANVGRHEGLITNLKMHLLIDGYPMGAREYRKIASSFGFDELFNAKELTLPSGWIQLDEPLEVDVVDKTVKTSDNRDEPWATGLFIKNPFQEHEKLTDHIQWREAGPQEKPELHNALEGLSNYDTLYTELISHHPISDDTDYDLNRINLKYLSELTGRNRMWNIDLSVDW